MHILSNNHIKLLVFTDIEQPADEHSHEGREGAGDGLAAQRVHWRMPQLAQRVQTTTWGAAPRALF